MNALLFSQTEARIKIWRKFQYYEDNIIYLNSFFCALGFCAILCFPPDQFNNRYVGLSPVVIFVLAASFVYHTY